MLGADWARRAMGLLLAAWMGLDAFGAMAGTEIQRAPAPGWVLPQAVPAIPADTPGGNSNGVQYLLVDQQLRLEAATKVVYRRFVNRAAESRGLENISHISIDFDPSYESLVLHGIGLRRDGQLQDRLATARVKMLQREQDLESRVYDGTLTADVVLEDVRVGDVVEYAYSVRGANPVFGKDAAGLMEVQWGVPVGRMHRRIVAPAGVQLHFQSYLTTLQPRSSVANGWQEHVWDADEVAPASREKDTPRWYDPNPKIRWSTYAGWDAVARWAAPLYNRSREPGPALRAEIARIAAAHSGAEDRVRAALQFAQSQIRYLGIEIGAGSHAPRSPDEVLARRYGDCKDKVLLAVAMLHGLGIEAQPALVNTRRGASVTTVLPSPLAFNHVVLRARVGGQNYWLDPTELTQKGRLDLIAQADFGQALLVDGAASGLVAIPRSAASVQRRHVDMRLDASQGYQDKVVLDVTTTFEGVSAEHMREKLRSDSLAELQRDYLNLLLRSYPHLSVAAPLEWKDDEAANRVVVHEHYRVGSLVQDEAKKEPAVRINVPDARTMLHRPDDTVRSTPLALRHSEQVRVTMTALLPEDWRVSDETTQVRNAAFEFDQASSYHDRQLHLSYDYRSLKDHVPPEDLGAYVKDLEAARDVVGCTLWPGKRVPAAALSAARYLSVAGLALLLALCFAFGKIGFGERAPPTSAPLGDRVLLLTGMAVLWIPSAILVSAIAQRLLRRQAGAGTGILLVFGIALIGLWWWHWRIRWFNWALARSGNPEALAAKARKLLQAAPPAAGISPDLRPTLILGLLILNMLGAGVLVSFYAANSSSLLHFGMPHIMLNAFLAYLWCRADANARGVVPPRDATLLVAVVPPLGVPFYYFNTMARGAAFRYTGLALLFMAALYLLREGAAYFIGVLGFPG